jgi:Peptidase family M50
VPSSQDHPIPDALAPFVVAWRTATLRDREVIDVLVHPAHARPSPQLAEALAAWRGRYYWSDEPGGRWLVLTRQTATHSERWALHVGLLLLTILSTTIAGAVFRGTISVDDSWGLLRGHIRFAGAPLASLAPGLAFSLPLVAILLAHELGHYFTARYYLLDTSPPYFLPVPLWPSFIGTMGAFIRLRTLLSDRRQLFDVGIAGPIAGFVVALPVLIVGLHLSHALPPLGGTHEMSLPLGAGRLVVGDSPVTLFARLVAHQALGGVSLHPMAFAGVVGMFVTMLNLMPMAQLDGGHILYAAGPRWHRRVASLFWLAILVLGRWWLGWLVWAGLVLVMSRGRLDHPTVLDAYRPLPRSRRVPAWAALALFLLTFAPVPFSFQDARVGDPVSAVPTWNLGPRSLTPNILRNPLSPIIFPQTSPRLDMSAQLARQAVQAPHEAVVHDLPAIRFEGQSVLVRLALRHAEDGAWRGRILFGAEETEHERATAEIFCATSEQDLWLSVRDLRDHHLRDLYRSLL